MSTTVAQLVEALLKLPQDAQVEAHAGDFAASAGYLQYRLPGNSFLGTPILTGELLEKP